jgi:hypothetical protein
MALASLLFRTRWRSREHGVCVLANTLESAGGASVSKYSAGDER